MAFLGDFLIAKEGTSKEGGVLLCSASKNILNYCVTKVDKGGPLWLPQEYSFAFHPYRA